MNRTHRLLHAVDLGPISSSGPAGENYQPASNFASLGNLYREVTFQVILFGVSGGPTSSAMDVRFQLGVSDIDGNQNSQGAWVDLDVDQVAKLIAEGTGFKRAALAAPRIYDTANGDRAASTSNMILVQRTISNFGKRVRIELAPTFSGGASPRIKTTVLAHGKR